MNSKKDNSILDNTQKLLLDLRNTFLEELPDRCDVMEELVLKIDKSINPKESFADLYRHIHSLKGSAGTHGLNIISSICHQFEDRLKLVGNNLASISPMLVDAYLEYIDLVRTTSVNTLQGNQDTSKTDQELARILNSLVPDKKTGLVVENSNFMSLMYRESLKKLPLECAFINDGIEALQRLMQQRFDFLVMGSEIKTLNGIALIYAVRASDSQNRNIKIIMVTSAKQVIFPDGLGPNYIIKKDANMSQNLLNSLQEIFKF